MRRVIVNATLYVVVMVAAALLVVAGVRTFDDDPAPTSLPVKGVVELDEASSSEQQRYADVIDAARAEATAFLNIRYDDAQTAIDAVLEGATASFRTEYEKSTEALVKLLEQYKSIRTGEVIWVGVVAQDPDSATVILNTTGTVQNTSTGEDAVTEVYRIQMQLVLEKGRWLTSDLKFVS